MIASATTLEQSTLPLLNMCRSAALSHTAHLLESCIDLQQHLMIMVSPVLALTVPWACMPVTSQGTFAAHQHGQNGFEPMAAGYNYQTHLDGPSCCFYNSATLLLWCLPCRYETSNHLWLILEYCVGGDLMSLLRQDMRLPESSIHDFGRDLVISIQYLHSNAIIYCDLKPSNILLDENGRIKLGGFGLSRRLSDINKTSLQQLPPVRLFMHSGAAWHAASLSFSSMQDCSTHHISSM